MPNLIFLVLLAVIFIFSCLTYGGVTVFSQTITESIIALAVLFWLSGLLYKRRPVFVRTGFFLPAIIFLSLVVFQLIPLPLDLIRVLSAKTAHLYEVLVPQSPLKGFFPLSLYPYATLIELFKVLAYLGIFFLAINNLEKKREFEFIINAIILFGVFISIFGIIQKYTYSGKVYWFDSSSSAPTPFGPFVNRNNFAGYINMIIPLALGHFITKMPLGKRAMYGLAVGIMSLALLLCLSRAGVVVYIAVLFFILLFSRAQEGLRARTKSLALGILIFLGLSLFFIDAKALWQRFASSFHKDMFVTLGHGYSWIDILRICKNFPLFGTGLGTFASISSMYKTSTSQSLFIYAHNDYLQLLAETGILGFITVLAFFILYFKSVINTWLARHDSYVIGLVLGGIASIFGMLLYSFLDFNLHIPACAILFFIIMGLIYRLVHTRFTPLEMKKGN